MKQNNTMFCFVRCTLNANFSECMTRSLQVLFASEVQPILYVIYTFPAITAIHIQISFGLLKMFRLTHYFSTLHGFWSSWLVSFFVVTVRIIFYLLIYFISTEEQVLVICYFISVNAHQPLFLASVFPSNDPT
jgi:hypothetical protein